MNLKMPRKIVCFTLQASTLKFNEELGLRSSNGVDNNDMSICRMGNKTHVSCPWQRCQMILLKLGGVLGRDPKGQLLGQGQQWSDIPLSL